MKFTALILVFAFNAHAEISAFEQACVDKMLDKVEIAVLNSNLANVNTTRTPNGGPYLYKKLDCVNGTCRVISRAAIRWEYEPEHPDANDLGYVAYPNFDINRERDQLRSKVQDLEVAERDCP